MPEVPSSTENTHAQGTFLESSKPFRIWLILISILAVILFVVDAVLAFAIISTSVDHLKTKTRSISNGVSILYSVDDFHNDLEVEIPSILINLEPIRKLGLGAHAPKDKSTSEINQGQPIARLLGPADT